MMAGWGAGAAQEAGSVLNAPAGCGVSAATGAAGAFAGALVMRSGVNCWPFAPKIPPTSAGTSTFLCALRRANWSGLSWARISGRDSSTDVWS